MIQMPKSGEVVEFTDGHKLLKAPHRSLYTQILNVLMLRKMR